MATISLRNLGKKFGAYTALENISLEIADREFLVLLGPSGCGKTTTMRMVAGLDHPTSGDILIDGKRVNDVHARDRDLAMVFQSYGLYPHMSVRDNICYPLKVRGMPVAARHQKAEAAAAKVELSKYLDRKPSELSGGQRQRVALARALVREPRVFLMDEPLSNLDAQLRTVMRTHLKHLQRDMAATTIYVTHDQVEAMTLADRIVVLNNGVIQQVATPAETYARPANTFVAKFIGSPPMNLLEGRIEGGAFINAGGRMNVEGAVDGPIVLGQRPEDMRVVERGSGHLSGDIYAAELLGDAVLVAVSIGHEMVNVKMPPDCRLAEGETIDVVFDPGKIHLFDAATGARKERAEPRERAIAV
ncbi:ABC transporter ATP-binding protein [Shinella sp.]|uniref:ABC transporter ATP-binding protein n=1 Tax=Shinella sp. TaxID=1870904 RepID=UPI0029BC9208|nr:ABC transporter ATP-binding protein [Shinella sp.]MDX3973522.1 ABC transporter ATP-binding protein [Shinella sp.]